MHEPHRRAAGAASHGLQTRIAALGLAERGHKVVVLEAHRIGWGASGRNGGFVSAGFALGPSELVRKVGTPRARELYRLTQDAVALVRRRAEAMEGVQPIGTPSRTLKHAADIRARHSTCFCPLMRLR